MSDFSKCRTTLLGVIISLFFLGGGGGGGELGDCDSYM